MGKLITCIAYIAILIAMLVYATILNINNAHAYETNDENAIMALIGESASEPQCMKTMAFAIRNRGTLRGVYGFTNPINRKSSAKTAQIAAKAWFSSANGADVSNGANHWLTEAEHAKNTAQWYKKCRKTVSCGSHQYYDCPWRN